MLRDGDACPHQMVCHLTDAFRVVVGQKPVSAATNPFSRTVIKWTALYAPLRWPPGILTRPEIDQEVGGTRPVEFAADVAQLEALIELVTTQRKNLRWRPHPIFGRMSETAWMRWAYLHVDHHLRQFGS